MSNIYIQEPPSIGKVLLKTSVGDIDIELWSKEAPKACRNFVQLCMEGYYDGTVFHRVVKDFIVQGGDPMGTGEGGESIYGAPFKDEFHSRLRFVRRGLVAMANAGPHDNGSQFFFTMAQTPELQNKHTIFGKVVGDTLYNMLKLQEVELEPGTEEPQEPHKIISADVLNNPFDDIIPRQIKKLKRDKEEEKKIKSKSKATKNFSLLSFGDEAEDDEEQTDRATESFRGKSKSSHDLTDDPRLSSVPALGKEKEEEEKHKKKAEESPDERAKKPEPPPPATATPDAERTPKDASPQDKKKSESPDDSKKKKPDSSVKEDEKRKRRGDGPDSAEKKRSPAAEESGGGDGGGGGTSGGGNSDSKRRKLDVSREEDSKRSKEESTKEDEKKKRHDGDASSQDSRSHDSRSRGRSRDQGGRDERRDDRRDDHHRDDRRDDHHRDDRRDDHYRDDRRRRSREREEEERRKRKDHDAREEESRKRRKPEEAKEEGGRDRKKGDSASRQIEETKESKETTDLRQKLKKDKDEPPPPPPPPPPQVKEPTSLLGFLDDGKQNRMEELKKEQRRLQRDIKDVKKRSDADKMKPPSGEADKPEEEKKAADDDDNDLLSMVKKERQKYKTRKKQIGRGDDREAATMAMLAKFQNKLTTARTLAGDYDDVEEEEEVVVKGAVEEEEAEDDPMDMSWMRHKLHFATEAGRPKTKVIDANIPDSDRYNINDPRNPLNQRRREASKKSMCERKK